MLMMTPAGTNQLTIPPKEYTFKGRKKKNIIKFYKYWPTRKAAEKLSALMGLKRVSYILYN